MSRTVRTRAPETSGDPSPCSADWTAKSSIPKSREPRSSMPRSHTCCAIIVAIFFAMNSTANAQGPYPSTRTTPTVDHYGSATVADPYRWLEDLGSAATKAWVESQNAVTFRYLETLPTRETFRRRITELW